METDEYQKLDAVLAKIPYCSRKCLYAEICPVADRTGSELAVCSLKLMDPDKRRRFANLFIIGRDGLKAEAYEALYNLAAKLDLKGNPSHIISYIDNLLKVDRGFKGFADLKAAGPPMKAPEEAIPEIINVSVSQKAKKPDMAHKEVVKVAKELEHPDSLYSSPVVDKLVDEYEEKWGLKTSTKFKMPIEKEQA